MLRRTSLLVRVGALLLGALLSNASGQTTITWQSAVSGDWFTAANWTPAVVPDFVSPNSYRAVVSVAGPAYTITATGTNSINVAGLDITSANARVLLNFGSPSIRLDLASGTSNWTSGVVEVSEGGIMGASSTATTINVSSGFQVLYNTSSGRLDSVQFNNSGTLRSSFGLVTIAGAAINNQAGGLIHADGGGIIFSNSTTLANSGTLRATGSGILRFEGTRTTASLGTVDLVSGGRARLEGTLTNTAATLTISGGGLELFGSTITGGTIAANSLTLTNSGGTLNGVTFTGAHSLPANSFALFAGTNAFTGATVTYGSNASLLLNNSSSTLTINSASTVTGDVRITASTTSGTALANAGTITHTTGNGSLNAGTLTNSGTISSTSGTLAIGSNTAGYNTQNASGGVITANGSGAGVTLTGNVTNAGTIIAQNSGIVTFDGNNVTSQLGTVQITTGGRVRLNGTLNNAAATLTAPTGGSYDLLGGTIIGGTIGANALALTNSGGTLNGVTFTGAQSFPANGFAIFSGSNALTGAALTFGSNASLLLNTASSTLAINSASTITGDVRITASTTSGTALTNAGAITHTTGSGSLYAGALANSGTISSTSGTLIIGSNTAGYNTQNASGGVITANGSGAGVTLTGNVSNAGTIIAQNSGIVTFDGNNVTSQLGMVQITTGGRVRLNGTLNNAAATLTAPTGGSYDLLGGTIIGGTIGAGALSLTNSGGTLNGVTFTGAHSLPANGFAIFSGSNALTGAALTYGSNASLLLNTAGSTLTINSASTLTGDVRITASTTSGTALTNAGTITHTTGSGSLYAGSLTNSGTISATSGSLTIGNNTAGYNSLNAGGGVITANGSGAFVNLVGNVANGGTILTQNSGVVTFQGNTLTPNLGTVQIATGGHVRLDGVLDNSDYTLTAPAGGSYELFSGTILGGTIASNALTFTNSGGTLTGVSLTGTLNLGANTFASLVGGNSMSGSVVTFGANSSAVLNTPGATLTINSASTLTGDVRLSASTPSGTAIANAGTITQTTGSGAIHAGTVTNTGSMGATSGTLNIGSITSGYNTQNAGSGTISANGSGAFVNLVGNVTNAGTILAQNSGVVTFQGNNLSSHLGNVQIATGGHVRLDGVLDNTAATLVAPTGGSYELFSGTILGGNISSNALTLTNSGGTLNGVNLMGVFGLSANTFASLLGSNSMTGSTSTFGANASLQLNTAGATLNINGASTLTGDIHLSASTPTGTAITNAGIITHTTGTGVLNAGAVTNTGSILAGSGTLSIGSNTAGYNTQNASGSSIGANGSGAFVNLIGNVTNSGTILAQNSGIVTFQGNNVTANLGNVQVASSGHVRLDGVLNNAAATLTAPTGGSYELFSGTINGGTIGSNALTFTNSGGTLNGVEFTGTLNLGANTFATLAGSNLMTGSTVTFGANSSAQLNTAGATLTINSSSTLTGDIHLSSSTPTSTAISNAGSVTQTTGSGVLNAGTVTNTGSISATAGTLGIGSTTAGYNTLNASGGTITANGSGATVVLIGNVTNSGTIFAQNSGVVTFQGNNVTANLGNVQIASSGHVRFDGVLNNAAATLTAPTGGSYELFSGTINGGTIGSNALTFTNSGGTLNGVTFSGTLNLGTNTFASLAGANAFSGSTATFGSNSSFQLNTANAALTIEPGSTLLGDVLIVASTGVTGTTITNQGVVNHSVGNGSFYARTLTNSASISATAGSTFTVGTSSAGFTTINTATGLISANGVNSGLHLVGTLSNLGTLRAENSGSLFLEGTYATADLGTVQILSGGRVKIDGTLNNAAATLNAPSGGSFELYSGVVNGGTIGSNALTFTNSGGTLNGVTFNGTLNLPSSTFATLSGANSLVGADVNFGSNSSLQLATAGATLTIDPGTTVVGDVSFSANSSTGTALTNFGAITQTAGSGLVSARTLTNSGSITLTAGSMTLGAGTTGFTSINTTTGTITVLSGSMSLAGPLANQGLVRVQAGNLFTNGLLTNQGDGVLTGAGTIVGDVFVVGGTLAPGNSIGNLTFSSTAFTVSAPTLLEIELGGGTADALVFSAPTAPVNLGSGLVSLSLNLLSAPTMGSTYDIVRISSGGNGITGTFAGLPTTGSVLSASFSGTPYLFSVSYQTNTISLQAIPEPGTYALIGVGLVGVWLTRRRRRA